MSRDTAFPTILHVHPTETRISLRDTNLMSLYAKSEFCHYLAGTCRLYNVVYRRCNVMTFIRRINFDTMSWRLHNVTLS